MNLFKPQKILVHDYAGHPFQVQLSRQFAHRGHRVLHLYAGYNVTPHGDLERKEGDPAGFEVEGVFIKEPLQKYNYFKRIQQETEYGRLVADKIRAFEPDVILSANTPLDAQRIVKRAGDRVQATFIFWLQDVLGLGAKRLLKKKLSLAGHLIGEYFINLEKDLLRSSNAVISISDDFTNLLVSWGVKPSNIITIPNWAPLSDIPVRDKNNEWSIRHQLEDKFVVLYSGTLGLKHNPSLLTGLARQFQKCDDFRLVVVSEGLGADWIRETITKENLHNVVLLPFQPFKELPLVLASADVLLTILEPEAGIFSVPSKVLTNFCAQRAQVLSCPVENLAAKTVVGQNAGFVVPAGNEAEFFNAVERLYLNPVERLQMGINGRMYAESNFDIDLIYSNLYQFLQRQRALST